MKQDYLDQFLTHLVTERRLSEHTATGYARDVRQLLLLTEGMSLETVKVPHVRRFVAKLHAGGLGPRSLARMLSAWRMFFHFLARQHGFSQNPCLGVKPPKAGKPLPETLSPEQAARLMETDTETALAVRDRAILELFYSSGLRLAELHRLDPASLSGDGTIRVLGKGGKERIVPVGAKAREAMAAWLPLRDQWCRPGEPALFISERGSRLSPRAIQYRLLHWARKLGLDANVHPHVLRHSFASHLLQSSGDLRAVQEMLGHASVATTQIYTHLDFQHLAKVYDAAHPRARKKGGEGSD